MVESTLVIAFAVGLLTLCVIGKLIKLPIQLLLKFVLPCFLLSSKACMDSSCFLFYSSFFLLNYLLYSMLYNF